MKGVIFNLVEEVVRAERGDVRWDQIVDDAGVSGAYTSLGSYPDSDLVDLAETVAAHVGTDPSSVIRHVGHHGIAILATRYPESCWPHDDVRSFLLTPTRSSIPRSAGSIPARTCPSSSIASSPTRSSR